MTTHTEEFGCRACGGTGGETTVCRYCKGSGLVYEEVEDTPAEMDPEFDNAEF